MSKTNIEWTGETWNPVTGCDKVSPGCDHVSSQARNKRREIRDAAIELLENGYILTSPGLKNYQVNLLRSNLSFTVSQQLVLKNLPISGTWNQPKNEN